MNEQQPSESATEDPAQSASDAPESMRKKTIRGTVYSIVGQGAKNVLRLGSNILLTHLLTAEDFGISTLVNTVIIGLEMISDLGIETSIVQHERGEDPDFLDTAFTVQFLRGLILFVLACICAYPASIYWDSPALLSLLPVAAMGALVRGLWPTKLHLLRRNLEVRKLVFINVGAQAVGVVVMAIHAYYYRSVWALILGSVAIFTTPMVVGHLMEGHRNRFRWDAAAAKELVGFGKWIFVSTMITFAADKFSIFASGRLVDKATLGVFGVSTMLATLPLMVGGHATNSVILPALSASARADRATLARAFARAQRVVLPILTFSALGLVLLSPAFFYLIYKPSSHDAGWMVQIGMLGVWFFYLQDAWSRALLALGISRPLAVANGAKLVGTVVLALVGFELYAFPGLIGGASLGAVFGYLAIIIALAQEGLHAWRLDLKYSVLALGLSVASVLLPKQLAPMLGQSDWRPLSIATSLLFLVPLAAFTFVRLKGQMRGSD